MLADSCTEWIVKDRIRVGAARLSQREVQPAIG